MEPRATSQDQFAAAAEAYVASPLHAEGPDLAALAEWAAPIPGEQALDLATGGGHVALALASLGAEVLATDLTPEMLSAAERHLRSRGFPNVRYQLADAQALPFRPASFDLVTCRIAAHHFPDPAAFVAEVRRVLKPGGRFLLEDSVVPPGPSGDFLNTLEALRDPSHVRSLTVDGWWTLLLEAGFDVARMATFDKRHGLDEWMARMRTPEEARNEVRRRLRTASPGLRRAFALEYDGGEPVAYRDLKALFLAQVPQ